MTILRLPGLADGEGPDDWFDRIPSDSDPDEIIAELNRLIGEAGTAPAQTMTAPPDAPTSDPAPDAPPPADPTPRTKLEQCVAWLRVRLADGEAPHPVITWEADQLGFKRTILNNAKAYANIDPFQRRVHPVHSGWWWRLADNPSCPS